MNQSLSNILNLIRWIATFVVVFSHLRTFLFVNYVDVEHHNIFTKIFYFVTEYGHQAVIVFFVLSGYLVGGSVVKRYKEQTIDINYFKIYLIKRFSRIYIVLIPSLIVGYILDSLGYINFPDLYTNAYHINAMNYNAHNYLSIDILFGNLLNLQTILVPIFGTNGPLWSLANEWIYYF